MGACKDYADKSTSLKYFKQKWVSFDVKCLESEICRERERERGQSIDCRKISSHI